VPPNRKTQAFTGDLGLRERRVRHDHHELFATVPCDHIGLAARGPQDVRDRHQHPVVHRVRERVADVFETIQI
jgi:hypothetical protein